MTNIYISPILGNISEDTYKSILNYKNTSYNYLLDMMKIRGIGVLRTGVLFVESGLYGIVNIKGSNLVDILISFGFSRSDSINIVRVFSVNNRLINQLVEKGFSLDDVIYKLDLKGRLKELGFASATVTSSYALEDIFPIYPTLILEEEEDEEEKEINIDIIPEELPFTIDLDETQETFINLIKSFEEHSLDVNKEDTERNLKFISFIELYYREDNTIEFKNEPTTYNIDVPVTGNRRIWLVKTIQSLYSNIVKRAIKRYKQQGITASPGNNNGSIDWRLIVTNITYYIKYY